MQPDVTVNKVLIYKFFGYLFAIFFKGSRRNGRRALASLKYTTDTTQYCIGWKLTYRIRVSIFNNRLVAHGKNVTKIQKNSITIN